MLARAPTRGVLRLFNEKVFRGIHEIVRITDQISSGIGSRLRSWSIRKFPVTQRRVTAKVGIGIGDQRPCLCLKIVNGVAVSAPALLVKAEVDPLGASARGYGVNADHLSGRR